MPRIEEGLRRLEEARVLAESLKLFNEHGEMILAKLSPQGYEELGRTRLIDPGQRRVPSVVMFSGDCGRSRRGAAIHSAIQLPKGG